MVAASLEFIPKATSNVLHSASEGRCHPLGQIPCTPLGLAELEVDPFITVVQSYKRPYLGHGFAGFSHEPAALYLRFSAIHA